MTARVPLLTSPRWLAALPWLVAASAALTIAAAAGALPGVLAFVFKPLTTILILMRAWPRGADQPVQRRRIAAGLALSLCGDVALLWPQEGFLPGLVFFLLAHLAYIAAFCVPLRLAARPWPFAGYGLVSAAILAFLWPGVPAGLRIPVLTYVVCLASMAAQAAGWWRAAAGTAEALHARSAAIGGVLFVVSDALLATNKFAAALPLSALWILSSYWLAQWLIAGALRPASPRAAPR